MWYEKEEAQAGSCRAGHCGPEREEAGRDPGLPTPRPGFSSHTHWPRCFGQGEGLDKQWQKNPVRVDSGGGLNVLTDDGQRITSCGSLGCAVVNLGDVLRSFQRCLIQTSEPPLIRLVSGCGQKPSDCLYGAGTPLPHPWEG